jgi:prepilin-type N-terminal cleavage/methylation domain-containing protein/prepilin-type processing-associated H-X9-DG protein
MVRVPRVSKPTAFTLLELLVVIAILTVLAVLLLPALGRAPSAAYLATCGSNLRQMGVGLQLYASDFRAYPFYVHGNGPGTSTTFWESYLEPYVGASWDRESFRGHTGANSRLYLCPGYAHLPDLWDPPRSASPSTVLGAYGYNWRGVLAENSVARMPQWFLGLGGVEMDGRLDAWNDFAIREGQVVSASAMIAVTDAPLGPEPGSVVGLDDFSNGVGFIDYDVESGRMACLGSRGLGQPAAAALASAIRIRHRDRWNALFCDGHVKAHRTQELFDWRNDAVLRLRNNDNLPHQELQADPP